MVRHAKRRSTEDGAAQDNMLSFDDYLPDGVMGMQDGLGTMEGSDHVCPHPRLAYLFTLKLCHTHLMCLSALDAPSPLKPQFDRFENSNLDGGSHFVFVFGLTINLFCTYHLLHNPQSVFFPQACRACNSTVGQ
jgi:hypothetical protein